MIGWISSWAFVVGVPLCGLVLATAHVLRVREAVVAAGFVALIALSALLQYATSGNMPIAILAGASVWLAGGAWLLFMRFIAPRLMLPDEQDVAQPHATPPSKGVAAAIE